MIKIMNTNGIDFNTDLFIKYVLKRNSNLEYNNVLYYVNLYSDICNSENIDILVALSQVLYETVNFSYRNKNKKDFHNPGGVRLNNKYVSFLNDEEGIFTHIQLLKGLATKEPLTNQETPYYENLKNSGMIGISPNVIGLGGTWVVPGYNKNKYQDITIANQNKDSYGFSIENIYNEYLEYIDDNQSINEEAEPVLCVETEIIKQEEIDKTESDNVVSVTNLEINSTNHTTVVNTSSSNDNVESSEIVYRVTCGSFYNETAAINIKNKLNRKKFNACVEKNNNIFKVYSGSFQDKNKAVNHMRRILGAGISCSIITVNTSLNKGGC